MRDEVTRRGLWVSTNAAVIDPSDYLAVAGEVWRTTSQLAVRSPQTGTVQAHHVIQSFDPSQEHDLNTVHNVGARLADAITAGENEYLVATHVDAYPVVNHIIFNAVSFETGRRYRVQKSTLARIRQVSNELCVTEGWRGSAALLSVFWGGGR